MPCRGLLCCCALRGEGTSAMAPPSSRLCSWRRPSSTYRGMVAVAFLSAACQARPAGCASATCLGPVCVQVAVGDAVQAGRHLAHRAVPLAAQVGHALPRQVSNQQVEALEGLQPGPTAQLTTRDNARAFQQMIPRRSRLAGQGLPGCWPHSSIQASKILLGTLAALHKANSQLAPARRSHARHAAYLQATPAPAWMPSLCDEAMPSPWSPSSPHGNLSRKRRGPLC